MPRIKNDDHALSRGPGLGLVGFRHDHQKSALPMMAAQFLKDAIFIGTSLAKLLWRQVL